MTQNEFLIEARKKISENPYSRLAAPAKAAVAQQNCTFDIHCHIFDKKCLNIRYLAMRMGLNKLTALFGLEGTQDIEKQLILSKKSEEELYQDIENNKGKKDSAKDWKAFDNEMKVLRENSELIDSLELFGYNNKGLMDAWKVLKKGSMEGVLTYFLDEFALTRSSIYGNRPFVTGILSMDLETGWGMKPDKTLSEQIDELKLLSQKYAILPFFAIDPRRADKSGKDENLYELFLKAFTEEGKPSFFGVKCYPALGYFPNDERLQPIFKICEEKNIPITTHCGGEVVSTFEKNIEFVGKNGKETVSISGTDRRDRAKFLNHPSQWKEVLENYPKLRVNFAHFGGDYNWATLRDKGEQAILKQIMDFCMDEKYSAFTDFSFNVIEKDLFDTLNKALSQKAKVRDKTLFGTDFWVVLPSGELRKLQEEFLHTLAPHRDVLVSDNPRRFLFGENSNENQANKPV